MATGPIETHLHRSFNWENGAPGARMGPRGRSASCGKGLSARCVRLRSEINRRRRCRRPRAQRGGQSRVPSPALPPQGRTRRPFRRAGRGQPRAIGPPPSRRSHYRVRPRTALTPRPKRGPVYYDDSGMADHAAVFANVASALPAVLQTEDEACSRTVDPS